MFCQECGAKMEEGQVFCSNCGTRVQEDKEDKELEVQKSFCPHCGAPNSGADVFCASCGGAMDGSISQPVQKKTRLPVLLGAAVLLVGCLVGLLVMLGGKASGGVKKQLFYIKDESLYKASLNKLEPMEVDNDVLAEENNIGIAAKCSPDERYLFYFSIDEEQNCDLYYLDTRDKDAEGEKIDSGIEDHFYEVTAENKVVYKKNGNLYVNDMKDKEKIASDVENFYVSTDGKKLLWDTVLDTVDDDKRLYVQTIGKEDTKEKLDSGIDYIYYIRDDFKYIVYRKNGALYLIQDLGEKEKIASDATQYVTAGESDDGIQIVYYEYDGEEIPMSRFVEDDMKEDADIKEPLAEDYYVTVMKNSWFGSYETQEVSEEYYTKYDEYMAKLERDSLREELENEIIYFERGKLVLYDSASGERTTVAEGCIEDPQGYEYVSMEGDAIATYTYINEENLPTIKFSKVYEEGIGEGLDLIDQGIVDNAEEYLLVGDATAEILKDGRELRSLDGDGKRLYAVTCEIDENGNAEDYELGEVSLKKDSLGEFTTLYQDASWLVSCEDGELIYAKDVDETRNMGDLYINDEKIDSDVNLYTVDNPEKNMWAYFVDMENGVGTVKLYDGKETEKVADDVSQACYFGSDKIAVLVDVSEKSGKGDLKLYNGKELEKIDTDVTRIVVLN